MVVSFFYVIFVIEIRTISTMTVKELIALLETLPEDYQVVFESGDAHGSAYYAYVDEIEVKDKNKEVELKEL